jgi:hypothetical protein
VGYRWEARFYKYLAPALTIPVPRCWFADLQDETNQGVVILDDLRQYGVAFGKGGMTYSVDEVAAGLELQATWHAATWDRTGPATAPWLTTQSPFFRHAMETMFLTPHNVERMLHTPQTASLGGGLRDQPRLWAGMQRLWTIQEQSILCLSHYDAHIGNTYRVPGELAPRFLDWQVFCLAPWADDVAYFMVGALDIADRREHEESLLRHYLEVLAGHGAAAPTFADAMLDVNRHHLHGVMWAFTPPQIQDPESCAAMAERHSQACIDHDTLKLLEA